MPTWVKLVVPFVLGVLAAVAVWFILPMMWYGCDVEHMSAGGRFARTFVMVAATIGVFLVTAIATTVTFMLIPKRRSWAPYATVGAAVVVAALVVLVSITVVHDPDRQRPNRKCPNGTPPWSRVLGYGVTGS